MDFLENLFSQEYFAPVLFIVIAVLAVLFIIVLIMALKDAKKNKAQQTTSNGNTDAFAEQNTNPVDVSVPVQNNVEVASPVVEENQVAQNNVIESIQPVSSNFENVNVEAPQPVVEGAPVATPVVENAQVTTPVNNEFKNVVVEAPTENVVPVAPINVTPEIQNTFASANEVSTPEVNNQDIKIESEPVANVNEVDKAENDLDQIAATLLKEYQNTNSGTEAEVASQSATSPVFVSPDTLPNTDSQVDEPSLASIPTPQPVRVTNTSTVIDSSKQGLNNIPTEEYNINK